MRAVLTALAAAGGGLRFRQAGLYARQAPAPEAVSLAGEAPLVEPEAAAPVALPATGAGGPVAAGPEAAPNEAPLAQGGKDSGADEELVESRLADPKQVWRRYMGGTPPPELTADAAIRRAMAGDLPEPEATATATDANVTNTTGSAADAVPVVAAPALEPTLAPWRFRNYIPVPTANEQEVLRFGPTPLPERKTGIDSSCVWQPGQYRCSCKDMLIGCNEASSTCEIKLQSEEMHAPEALKRHFKAVFDRPLLNTLQQPTARLHENEHGVLGFPIPNYPWPSDDFSALLKGRADKFRPPEPAEYGHPLFADDAKVRFGSPSSECTAEEFKAIETCFTYFFGCYKNLKDLGKWRDHVDSVTRQELRYG